MDKHELRTLATAKRARVKPEARAAAPVMVMQKLLKELAMLDAKRQGGSTLLVGLYVDCGTELSTLTLEAGVLSQGFRVSYPVCFADGRMEYALEADGAVRGLIQKKPSHVFDTTADAEVLAGLDFVEPTDLDALVVPLLGFDLRCYRLGMGGGYYDRYLPRLAPGTPTIGVAFDEQWVEGVPNEAHDCPLSAVIIPSRDIIRRQNPTGA
ncbi:MAG: 5-formyltetrahydrofolate cyclo-ligase [Coriobacteriales bacterium]|nr:5-formyltetrahydrofolate cyclo-ligase [Coriobacteriales bacterium]